MRKLSLAQLAQNKIEKNEMAALLAGVGGCRCACVCTCSMGDNSQSDIERSGTNGSTDYLFTGMGESLDRAAQVVFEGYNITEYIKVFISSLRWLGGI